MSFIDIVDLSSDDECRELPLKAVKLEPVVIGNRIQQKDSKFQQKHRPETHCKRQESEENRSSNVLSTGQSGSSILDQGQSPVDDSSLSSTSPTCPAPLCRQFWKAGNYNDGLGSKVSLQNGKNYLLVHPMFLHSNATSHKWAFGAVAELLDNAVDEIQNGATFVVVDKTTNPRDGSPALLIQDNGGGMDPEAMRQCMSFGFSDKKSKSAIGQYGNGFKTSTMRLGADVIVFSRHTINRIRTLTQSIGLLSYTFLTRTGHDRIVVPMVDYKFNTSTGTPEILHAKEHFISNLSMLLQWSPFSTESELLKQFDDIGPHGTKVIIYNLWFNDDGDAELDFESDPEDIRISGETKRIQTKHGWKTTNEQHIANKFHYSLRVYLSILYLRVPQTFNIILRGRVVEHHNIADDLKYPEFILYRPQCGGYAEGQVITTIGFLKDAPHVSFHGFNVYHKNRLILPFWQVVSFSDSRGRGVVGVLQADFIEPTHNKQEFERTSLFQKLECRLKEMTLEYWDYHCGLIGYQVKKKLRTPELLQISSHKQESITSIKHSPAAGNAKAGLVIAEQLTPMPPHLQSKLGLLEKRKERSDLIEVEKAKRRAVEAANVTDAGYNQEIQPLVTAGNQPKDQEAVNLLQENKKLRAKCLEYEKREEELKFKVTHLKIAIEEVNREYNRMLGELESLNTIKEENIV